MIKGFSNKNMSYFKFSGTKNICPSKIIACRLRRLSFSPIKIKQLQSSNFNNQTGQFQLKPQSHIRNQNFGTAPV